LTNEGARKLEGGTRDVIDGLEGCLDLSHGRIAVLKADREARVRGVIRLMDVRGLRRVVLGAIEVAIVGLTPF
jgi:hypothetical protein